MKFKGVTSIGNIRKSNEDTIYLPENNGNLFIVADGMGGHLGGEVASSLAVEIISKELENREINSLSQGKDLIFKAVSKANLEILNKSLAEKDLRGMGTTLSLLYIFGEKVLYTNIGDSRIYTIKDNEIKQITIDDSLVNYLLKIGEISEEEANKHPKRNILTQALGTSKDLNYKVLEVDNSMEYILLCSDGLTNMVNNEKIKSIILNNGLETAIDKLLEEALKSGGVDNISMILIDTKGWWDDW